MVQTDDRAEGGRRGLDLLGDNPLEGKGVFLKLNFNGGDPGLAGEVSKEGVNLRFAHVARVALAVEENEAPGPGEVGGFGAEGVVLAAEGFADR